MFNRTLGRLAGYKNGLLILIGLAILVVITLHHIGTEPAGLSPAEATSKIHSLSPGAIIRSPLNAPHRLVLLAAHKARPSSHGTLRLASYIYGLFFSASFYYLARSWFGKTVGALSTLVFCLSPFFLIPARTASAEIMLFWPVALMAAYHWLNKTDRKVLAWMALTLGAGLALYTPGLIWWIIGAVIICRKKLLSDANQLPQAVVAAGLLLLILLLVPAGLAGVRDWHFLRDIAALPGSWPSPVRLAENLGWMVVSLAVRTPYHDTLGISRLPMLDLIQLGLLVFGGYALWTASRPKTAALGSSVLLAVILAAINNDVGLLRLGLPAIGILMAAGLRYLYIEWRGVFPRNPIPKSFALVLMSVLVGIQLVYGLSYGLVAWPHSPDTKSVYVLK